MTGIGGVSTVAQHEQLAVGRERFPEFFDDLFDGGQRDAVESCFLFFKILVEIGLHGYRSAERRVGKESVRVDLGGSRIINQKNHIKNTYKTVTMTSQYMIKKQYH